MSAIEEVFEVGVDDYWAELSGDVMERARAELARLKAAAEELAQLRAQLAEAERERDALAGKLSRAQAALMSYSNKQNWCVTHDDRGRLDDAIWQGENEEQPWLMAANALKTTAHPATADHLAAALAEDEALSHGTGEE